MLLFAALLCLRGLFVLFVHYRKDCAHLELVQMPVSPTCDQLHVRFEVVPCHHVENRVWEDESADQFVLYGVIKIEELVIRRYAVNPLGFDGDTDDMVDNNPTESDILDGFICLLLKQEYILLGALQYCNYVCIFEQEDLFCRYFQAVKMLILLKMTVLSLEIGLLPINEIISKILKPDHINTRDKQNVLLLNINQQKQLNKCQYLPFILFNL